MTALSESSETFEDSMRRRRSSWFVSSAATVEALLGLTAVFVIGFGPAVTLGLLTIVQLSESVAARNLAGIAGAVGLAVASVVTLASALWTAKMASSAANRCLPDWLIRPANSGPSKRRSPTPLAIVLARRIPRFSPAMRIALGGWWLLHFAAGIGLHVAVVTFVNQALQGVPPWVQLGVLGFGDFAVTFAANVYGIMAITVLSRDWSLVRGVWRARYVLDLTIVAMALWLMP